MFKLAPAPLIPAHQVTKLVEQSRGFNFNMCELNIYETRKKVMDLPLSFDGFTITSMLRGTKQVRLQDKITRDYIPGNTILVPSTASLSIDFPQASFEDPTQCSALTLDNSFVKTQIDEFNEILHEGSFIRGYEAIDKSILLYNNEELINIHKKITRLSESSGPFKEIHIKMLLKEMILCVMKMQNVNVLKNTAQQHTNNSPFSAIINFIRQNIYQDISVDDLLKVSDMSKSSFYRAFVTELGLSPYQLIIEERIKAAKKLLLEERLSIKETAYSTGFSSANYFIRLFKKHEGMTPKQFVLSKLNH